MTGNQPPGDRPLPSDNWWWIFDPRLSLRARAVLLVGGGALVFTVLVLWLSGTILRGHLTSQLGRTFESLAYQVSDKIDRTLYERYHEVLFVAALPSFRAADTTFAERRRLIESLLASSPEFAWIGFADPAGNVLSASQGLFEHANFADRGWFRGAREKPYFGNVQELPDLAAQLGVNGLGGTPRFLDLAVPVQNDQGKSLGVLAAHVHWWPWTRDVMNSVVPEAVRRDRISVTVYGQAGAVLLDSSDSEPPDAPVIPERRGQRGFLEETSVDGIRYITGYVRTDGFREFRGLNWIVTVRQPVANAFAAVQQLQRSLARWGFGFVVGLTALSWFVAGRIAHQMQRVTAAARRVRQGDPLAVLPRPAGNGELAVMCGEIDDLVEDLRKKQPTPPQDDPNVTPRFYV